MLTTRIALWVCVLISLLLAQSVESHTDADMLRVADAIQILQPATETHRARRLARHFLDAADETWIDPLLLVAMSMRESSLLESVEACELTGALGELGLLQVHGVALLHRPVDCDLPLHGARCQIHTGARYLNYVRELCGGSTWRWVFAYGCSSCPTETGARQDRGTRLARRYYREVGGQGW